MNKKYSKNTLGHSILKKKTYSFVFFLFLIIGAVHAQFVHPGLTNKRSDLDRVKYMVEAQIDPWYTSYQEMTSDSKASYNYNVQGDQSFTELGRDDGTNYAAWNDDIRAAYYNAIQWYVTGDTRHADKSVEIFNAWNNLQDVTSGGTRALSGGIAYIMIEAAEIIKSTYTGWSASDIKDFKDMLVYPYYSNTAEPSGLGRTKGSFYWQAYQGDRVRHGNQGLAGFRAVMAMGIFMDNEIMYNRALRYIQGENHYGNDIAYPYGKPTATSVSNVGTYEDTWNYIIDSDTSVFGFNEVMTNYIYDNGQCQESSRDQQHTFFGIGNLCAMAEMAWNQGDDLYSHVNDRLLLGLEYSSKYNVSYLQSYPDQTTHWIPTVASGEFTQRFNSAQRVYAKYISPTHVGGYIGNRPVLEMPLAHYYGRGFKTLEEVKWTTRARDVAIVSSGYEDAGHQNGAIGWGALTSRRPEGCYGDPISGFDSNSLPDYNMNVLEGTIEAEHFDYSVVSGEGRVYNDLSAGNSGGEYRTDEQVDLIVCSEGGYNVTSIQSGEWLTYTVSVPVNGTYDLSIRYAAANGNGKIKFNFGGTDITSEVSVPFGAPNSTSLTDWQDFKVAENVNLSKGVQVLKLLFSGTDAAFELNNFTVALVEAAPEEPSEEGLIDEPYDIPAGSVIPDPFYGWNPDYSTTYGSMAIDEANDQLVCTFEDAGSGYIRFYWRKATPSLHKLNAGNYPIIAMKGERPENYNNFTINLNNPSGTTVQFKDGSSANGVETLAYSKLLPGTTDVYYWDLLDMIGSTDTWALNGFNCVNTLEVDPVSVMRLDYIKTFVNLDALKAEEGLLNTNDVENNLGLSIYPNPTSGVVSIKSKQLVNANVTVYDLNGRVLLSTNINGTLSEINMSNLASGMYLFKVQAGNSAFTKRIVKH